MIIKKYTTFVNEGMQSENIINKLTEIILERVSIDVIKDNYNSKYNTEYDNKHKPTIEYLYKTFFQPYNDDDFVKQMFAFFKQKNRNPKIIFRFERKFSYHNYQTHIDEPYGFYNLTTSDIQVNIWETKLDLKKIKETLSHELKHMYEDVIRNGVNYDNDKDIEYKNKPTEIRARITGFINSYEGWDKNIDDIIKDAENSLKSENYDRRKLLKILSQLKQNGLKKHTIIPSKKFQGRKSDIESFLVEAEKNDIINYYEKKDRTIEIAKDILGVNSIDENTGELGYPLLDMLLDIYENKNINILMHDNNLSLVLILKEKYKKDIIKVREKQHWSRNKLNVFYLLSKSGKIPNYEKISDVEELNYDTLIKKFYNSYSTDNTNLENFLLGELGLDKNHMITMLQKIIDTNHHLYMKEDFYFKYKDLLSFDNADIHYIEYNNVKYYIINAIKNLRLDKLQNEKSYKRIK